jgi:hypothetical protein
MYWKGRCASGSGKTSWRRGLGLRYLCRSGTPHTYWNPGPGLVRYLLVMTSNVYALIQEIHAMTDRSPAALSATFQRHDSELLG